MKPKTPAYAVWELLSGSRLSIACMAALIALTAVGQGVSAWVAGADKVANPELLYWARVSGLADVTRSGWFIFVLGVMVLNLLADAWRRFPRAFRDARRPFPPALGRDAEEDESLLRSEIETTITREGFLEFGREWCRNRLGNVKTVQKSDGAVQLASQRGRFASLLRAMAHLCVVVAVAGVFWSALRGMQARVLVEEGVRARAVELRHGAVPESWTPVLESGKPLAGYYSPGFEIERVAGLPEDEVVLRFYQKDVLIGSEKLSPGSPARFRGLSFHYLGLAPASARDADLTVVDRANGGERRFTALAKGQSLDMESYRFEVLEIQPQTDLNGPALELEYAEPGKAAERFWVFRDYPDYDFAHRKAAREHFTLDSVRQHSAADIQVSREPGAMAIWGGLLCLAGLLWVSMARPQERFWLRWSDGKVELYGWSVRPLLFEPHFFRLAALLEDQIDEAAAAAADGPDRAAAPEGQHA